ncbi:MAG: monoamine oxidase, partial [Acidimicrobiaceae bacterium]|nr:monoamine oxidase [Acidimicrobiaceae bacterium]
LAGHLQFDPPLPANRALLFNQMPAGTEIKSVIVYDEPFWRADGLSGASAAMDALFEVTLDVSPPSGDPGMISLYAAGAKARKLGAMTQSERNAVAIDTIRARFGPKAAKATEVVDQNWVEEQWTRGCSMAHFGTGVLTQFGRGIREPFGQIHWAGTETATTSHGAIDGAVRSGERVAAEILHGTDAINADPVASTIGV